MTKMTGRKNPWVAVLLQLIIAGLGHLYLERLVRGAVFILLDIATTYLYLQDGSIGYFILSFSVTVIAMYDSYKLANEINRNAKEDSDEPVDMPDIYVN